VRTTERLQQDVDAIKTLSVWASLGFVRPYDWKTRVVFAYFTRSLLLILLQAAIPVGRGSILFGSMFAWGRGEIQAIDMCNHFGRTSPPTEIETGQLIRSSHRGPAHPQSEEQAGNQGHVHLQLYPIRTVTEQLATA
jgi:hypothetical protein